MIASLRRLPLPVFEILLFVLGAGVAVPLANRAIPGVVRTVFCAPAAWLSSQFLGVALLPLADGFRLNCLNLPVDITLACSGATFFALLYALLLHRLIPGVPAFLRALVLAYMITIAANTARIVLGWHAAVWAHDALPASFHSGVHLAVGVIVFSSFLLGSVFAAQACKPHQIAQPQTRTSA
jgi:exosortase/archaeosortase family protein